MRYLIFGFIAGMLLSVAPVWKSAVGTEIYPEWSGKIDSIGFIDESINPELSKIKIQFTSQQNIWSLSGNGRLLNKTSFDNRLVSFSKNSKYYVEYGKVGDHVELLDTSGNRFWRIKSREYPHITNNGKIILLVNGDTSRIRIVDVNGSPAGAREIHGGLCTALSMSKENDFSGLGFLDGGYYFLNDRGEILNRGTVPDNLIVKGVAMSDSGNFFIVHYGNNQGDFIRFIDSGNGKSYTLPLKNIHLTKMPMLVTNDGNMVVIDYNRIIVTDGEDIENIIKIPPKRPGISSIDHSYDMFITSYTGIDGLANFFIFCRDGSILFRKVFPQETYIESEIYQNVIFLRGSSNLYCYSFRIPDNR